MNFLEGMETWESGEGGIKKEDLMNFLEGMETKILGGPGGPSARLMNFLEGMETSSSVWMNSIICNPHELPRRDGNLKGNRSA